MSQLLITRHAAKRAQQRCVSAAQIETVLKFADIELPVGRDCLSLRLSLDALSRLETELGPEVAARVKTLVLIVADDTLITVLRAHGLPSRRYRQRRRRL